MPCKVLCLLASLVFSFALRDWSYRARICFPARAFCVLNFYSVCVLRLCPWNSRIPWRVSHSGDTAHVCLWIIGFLIFVDGIHLFRKDSDFAAVLRCFTTENIVWCIPHAALIKFIKSKFVEVSNLTFSCFITFCGFLNASLFVITAVLFLICGVVYHWIHCLWFQLLDEKKLSQTENLYHDFETPEAASRV